MSFHSFSFLGFFAVTLALCLLSARRHENAAKACLTLASFGFYLWGFGRHALLGAGVLALGVVVTAGAARAMAKRRGSGPAAQALGLAVAWHIAVLLLFKYAAFFTGGAVELGWVPLGLSFFTFQQLWYLKEVYTGEFTPVAPRQLLLYAFFFPTVSSGPILRPGGFFPQLEGKKFLHPEAADEAAGLYLFSMGLAKKVLLADAFAVLVNNGYAHADNLTRPAAWLTILGYTLQLYFDFSGYCDMATGLARLLGLRLPKNFDSPYRACSVGEFWEKWHITLTTFLRECLYFPLGGNRRGALRTYGNILLVFLVSGIWHGAGWTFLLWGTVHGLAQILERICGERRNRLPKIFRWALTFFFLNLSWVFFRAPSLSVAGQMVSAAFFGGTGLAVDVLTSGFLASELDAVQTLLPMLAKGFPGLAMAALYVLGVFAALWPVNALHRAENLRPTLWRAVGCATLLAWSILSFTGITTFLYSNF